MIPIEQTPSRPSTLTGIILLVNARLKRFCRNTNSAWHAAKRIERINFCSLIVSVLAGLMHTIHSVNNSLGGPGLLYLEIQTVLLIFGLVLLLLHSCQKLGASLEANQRLQTEQKQAAAQLQTAFDAQIKQLTAEIENSHRALRQKHIVALKSTRVAGRKRRAIFCRNFHCVGHLTRNLVMMLLSLNMEPSKDLVMAILIEYCNSLAHFFEELHGLRFGVAVKVLVSPTEIVTIARDERTIATMRSSADGDRSYRLQKNTAFYSLMSCEKKVFACDNLGSLAESLAYQNETPNWPDLYNATACVPIRKSYIDNHSSEVFEMVGFLCVDCLPSTKKKAIFCRGSKPDEDVKNLLLGYADVMFALLKRGRAVANTSANAEGFVLDLDNFPFMKDLHEVFTDGTWRAQRTSSLFDRH